MMAMEENSDRVGKCVSKGKQMADGTGIYFYLFLCLFAACFFPPVRGFSEEWLRPKWVLAETTGLLVLLTLGIQVLVARDFHDGDGRNARQIHIRRTAAACRMSLYQIALLYQVRLPFPVFDV